MNDVKQRWRLIARAMSIVWLLVPCLAVAIVYFVHPRNIEAATLLVMAICPGVPLVVYRSKKSYGDPKTTLLVLLATALSSFFMIPLWAAVLSRTTPLELTIGMREVAGVLLPTLLIPYAIGTVIGDLAPRIAKPLASVAQALFIAGAVVVLIAIVRQLGASFSEVGPRGYLAAVLIPVCAAGLGYAASQPAALDDRISITYASALGNPALCLAIMAHSFDVKVVALVVGFVLVRAIALVPFNLWFKHRSRTGETPLPLGGAQGA